MTYFYYIIKFVIYFEIFFIMENKKKFGDDIRNNTKEDGLTEYLKNEAENLRNENRRLKAEYEKVQRLAKLPKNNLNYQKKTPMDSNIRNQDLEMKLRELEKNSALNDENITIQYFIEMLERGFKILCLPAFCLQESCFIWSNNAPVFPIRALVSVILAWLWYQVGFMLYSIANRSKNITTKTEKSVKEEPKNSFFQRLRGGGKSPLVMPLQFSDHTAIPSENNREVSDPIFRLIQVQKTLLIIERITGNELSLIEVMESVDQVFFVEIRPRPKGIRKQFSRLKTSGKKVSQKIKRFGGKSLTQIKRIAIGSRNGVVFTVKVVAFSSALRFGSPILLESARAQAQGNYFPSNSFGSASERPAMERNIGMSGRKRNEMDFHLEAAVFQNPKAERNLTPTEIAQVLESQNSQLPVEETEIQGTFVKVEENGFEKNIRRKMKANQSIPKSPSKNFNQKTHTLSDLKQESTNSYGEDDSESDSQYESQRPSRLPAGRIQIESPKNNPNQ